jgi:hypothetical protein
MRSFDRRRVSSFGFDCEDTAAPPGAASGSAPAAAPRESNQLVDLRGDPLNSRDPRSNGFHESFGPL